MTRYAARTSVPVSKTRAEIEELLRAWGCDGIQWTDHFKQGTCMLQFLWTHEEQQYLARFSLQMPDLNTVEKRCRHTESGRYRTGRPFDDAVEKEVASAGRTEMRVLLLWLKAALNAVDVGIISAETLFLPFLVGQDGRTVAEVATPRLSELLGTGASSLLGLPAIAEGSP